MNILYFIIIKPIGDIVPEVKITDLNLWKTDFIANEESKQAKFNKGSFIEPSFGFGSIIIENCCWCGVETSVENCDTVHKATNL